MQKMLIGERKENASGTRIDYGVDRVRVMVRMSGMRRCKDSVRCMVIMVIMSLV